MSPKQLLFNLPIEPSYSLQDFILAPSNQEAFQWLQSTKPWESPFLILYGPSGCGKTHLAHIWAQQVKAQFLQPLIETDNPLSIIESATAFVLDPIESTFKHPNLLFHFFNLAKAYNCKVLLTAETPPIQWPIELPDLASRLKASPAIAMTSPNDELIVAVLRKLLHDSQTPFSEEVIPYLTSRIERSFKSLRKWVFLINEASLREKRAVTIPFVRQLFNQYLQEDTFFAEEDCQS